MNTRCERVDLRDLSSRLSSDAERFCRHFFPDGRKVGNYWQIADTSGAMGQSLSIRLQGVGQRQPGKWVDHATGEHGDLLDLLSAQMTTCRFSDVIDIASEFVGHRPAILDVPTSQSRIDRSNDRSGAGRRLFTYAKPISGTHAEAYLRHRHIVRFGRSLAFHPSAYVRNASGDCLEFPALLGAIMDNDGQITGCSRTFLSAETSELAAIPSPKRVLGSLFGYGIRFGPWRSATDLIVGEGLENVLSVGSVFPMAALTSCLTANHLAGFNWPHTVDRLWIAHDNDEAGRRAAETLRERFTASGGDAHLMTSVREDFNLDLKEEGLTPLRQRLAAEISGNAAWHDLWPMNRAA